MSISDVLMWRYFELLSFRSMAEIAALRRECEEGRNPRDAKVMLAQEIVARFHSRAGRRAALAEFEARFRDGAMPDDMPEVTLRAPARGTADRAAREAGGARRVDVGGAAAHRAARAQGRRRRGGRQGPRRSPPAATVVVQAGKRKFARVTLALDDSSPGAAERRDGIPGGAAVRAVDERDPAGGGRSTPVGSPGGAPAPVLVRDRAAWSSPARSASCCIGAPRAKAGHYVSSQVDSDSQGLDRGLRARARWAARTTSSRASSASR